METAVEFSGPVLVAEGVAFCVSLPGRKKCVAVATRSCLALANDADDAAMLAAFRAASEPIRAAAVRLVLQGAATPLYLEAGHLQPLHREARQADPTPCA